jgi:hypothetical protein
MRGLVTVSSYIVRNRIAGGSATVARSPDKGLLTQRKSSIGLFPLTLSVMFSIRLQ